MAMETNELIDIHELTPFKKFIMSIGAIPTSYLESMTYAELLMWFCNYLQNTVIPTVNNNSEAVEELQNLYTILHDYVENYFDNLDVQEEINNKLDTMVEDGTMEELLSHMYKYNYNFINLESYFEENITFTEALTNALQDCSTYNKNLVIPKGDYTLTASINIGNTKINGNNSVITIGTDNLSYCFTGTTINIENLSIDLNNKCYALLNKTHYSDINLNNINVTNGITLLSDSNFSQDGGIYLDGSNVNINNVKSSYNKGHGIILNPTLENSIYNINNIECNFNGNGTTNISHGIMNIDRYNGVNYKSLTISNSIFNNNNYTGLGVDQAINSMVINCIANSNGEHGITYMDGKNGCITNCQMNDNTACGIRIQGDYSLEYDYTGYNNLTVSNCIIKGTHGIGIGNDCHNIVISNNIINATNYTVYVLKSNNDKAPCSDIFIKDNYLYSTNNTLKADVVVNGKVNNLFLKNYCNGKLNSRTRYFSNGAFLDYNEKFIGDITNIVTDSTDMLSSNWLKYGTVNESIVYANSGGYYIGQVISITKNTDYLSVLLKIDPTLSTEDELGLHIDLMNDSTSVASLTNRRYVGNYDELSLIIKISDITNVTEFNKIRIRIIGQYGKYIKPLYLYANQSNCIAIN